MAANVSIKSKPYLHHANNVSVYAVPEATRTNSPSPPSSPPHQSSFSRCRRRPRSKLHSHPLREFFSGGVSLRRNVRNFVFLPLLYVSGLIMCVGPFSALSGKPLPPGSLYRSHEMFQRLWNDIEAQNSSTLELSSVWKYKRQKELKPCLNSSTPRQSDSPGPSGYLIVDANGGLNQQRSAICNAVAVAGLLNAILVIPRFEFHSVWRDSSTFADIYDEDHFIATLDGFVKVVKDLPQNLLGKYDNNISNVPKFRVQAWAPTSYYMGEVYPVLQREGVIRIAPFANRLAMSVPPQIQFLRCLANYEALRFSSPIISLAQKLVSRMIEKSSNAEGKYLSAHLRFEEDMVAFSCCVYDGGESEKVEMNSVREKGWRKKFKREDHIILPGLNRVNGKCPLTPLEVGLMLRGMGFGKNNSIYLASGKIFQEEKQLAPLQKMFPHLHTKETLATLEELASFMVLSRPRGERVGLIRTGYSSRLAALDYTVCLFSEVFVTTQGGNFPHFLMGHRRFLNDGHAKTIMPDKRKLAVLLEDMSMSWNGFKEQMEIMLAESDRKGLMVPRVRKINRKTSVYTFPLPECRCLQRTHNANLNHDRNFTIVASNPGKRAIDT